MTPVFRKLSELAERYYARQKCEYHNFDHAKNVVAIVKFLMPRPSDALLLAALWHDAVYIPRAKNDANEYASSAVLNYEFEKLRKAGVSDLEDEEMVGAACGMIERTRLSVHLMHIELLDCQPGGKNEELGILLDADLSSLAAPYEVFVQNQRNIILENFAEVNKSSHIASADFLSRLANVRPMIYHTSAGRLAFEDLAQANIKRYRTDCDSGAILEI